MKQLNHKLIHEFLEHSAERYPDKIALIHEDTRATYAEINTQANHLAQHLMDSNVNPGNRVIIILENSLNYVISYYGILKAGAVAVPLSTDLKPDNLNPLLAELEPAAIITNDRFDRLIKATDQALIRNIKIKIQDFNFINNSISTKNTDGSLTKSIKNSKLKIQNSPLACIIYTSGSTGKPKGVMLSHANIVSNVHSICQYLALSKDDIQMVVLPFFYVMGKSLLNTHFAVGGTIVINNKFAFPASVIQQMAEENVTGFSGVPSTYAYLLHRSPLKKYHDRLSALRYCSQAGGHMARQIKEELPKALPKHTKIFIMYGATEAGARLTYLDPDRYTDKIDSIGKAIPNVAMSVLDKDGKPFDTGEKGELVASGPNIFMGYWKDKEATDRILDDKGYHTGDTGYQDEEGFFYVTGRKDDLVKVGGHRINPQEVEDALLATGLIIEAAVLGVPDDLLGNKLMALAVSKNGEVSEQSILSECHDHLPKYKMPESVKLIRALPKNASGKVDKAKCLEMIII
ncbi:class I adenylate-forming enzyme family protein [Thermodesulfobacteriota bacterium]